MIRKHELLLILNLSYSDDDLPGIRGCKHVEIYLDLKLVNTRPPGDVANDLLPVVVTALRC